MLQVKTPDEVFDIIETYFAEKKENTELVSLESALGRILAVLHGGEASEY